MHKRKLMSTAILVVFFFNRLNFVAVKGLETNNTGRQTVLKLAEKYDKMARKSADAEEITKIEKAIPWHPVYDGKAINAAKAAAYSYPSALLTAYSNDKSYYLAVAAAVLSLAPDNIAYIDNFAAAVTGYGEAMLKTTAGQKDARMKSYCGDAESLMQQALLLAGGQNKPEALQTDINLGNLYLDLGENDKALKLLSAAFTQAPANTSAIKALAGYYLAVGNKGKAFELLLKIYKLSPTYSKMGEKAEATDDSKVPELTDADNLDTMEKKTSDYKLVEPVIAADYFEALAPDEVKKVDDFVKSCESQLKYSAPLYNYVSQYTKLKTFSEPMAQSAMAAFGQQLGNLEKAIGISQGSSGLDTATSAGLNINMNADLSDVMKNPENYEDDVQVDVGNVQDFVNNLQDELVQAVSGLQSGDTSGLANMVADKSPEMGIFTINAEDYVDPTDILAQQNNMSMLNKKMAGYEKYYKADVKYVDKVIADCKANIDRKTKAISKNEQTAMDAIASKYHRKNGLTRGEEAQKKLDEYNTEMNFNSQYNQVIESEWHGATNYVNVQYMQHFKPSVEAAYNDCMKYVLLVSDTKVRSKMEQKVDNLVLRNVAAMLNEVLQAYSCGAYINPPEFDEAAIAEAKNIVAKEYAEAQKNKALQEAKAKQEFMKNTANNDMYIPEGSPLYQKLDSYSSTFSTPFIEWRISPVREQVILKAEFPGGVKVSFDKTDDLNRNTSTYGTELTLKEKFGPVKAECTFRGEVAVDGNTHVSTIDTAVNMKAYVETGAIKSTVSVEASVQRGTKISAQEEQMLNTGQMLKAVGGKEMSEGSIKQFLPEKKKKLWKGEYMVSK